MTFRYRMNGKPLVEHAQLTVALRKAGAEWKITGWSCAEQRLARGSVEDDRRDIADHGRFDSSAVTGMTRDR